MNPQDLAKLLTGQPSQPPKSATQDWALPLLIVAVGAGVALSILLWAGSRPAPADALNAAYAAGFNQAAAVAQATITELKQEMAAQNVSLNTLRAQLNYLTQQAAANEAALNTVRQQATSYVSYTNAQAQSTNDPYAIAATSGNVTIVISSAGVGLYVATTTQGGQR